MSKVSIEEVNLVLNETALSETEKLKVIQKLEQVIREEKENKEPREKSKNQFIGITTGNDVNSAPVWIIQAKGEMDHTEVVPLITAAVKDFNQTKKGSKQPIKTIAEAFEHCKKKLMTERGISPKTKEPIIIVKTVNEINFNR
jgi:hypothetical protein